LEEENIVSNRNGNVAVVIGCSASRGAGWQIAMLLARGSAKVVVAPRGVIGVQELAARIVGTAVGCDIANEAQVEQVAKTALAAYGHVDIAVNSAGLADTRAASPKPRRRFYSGR
jgi:NAD(P)-dependent dehydrogenase (short-subunit alcohol dehydrogenase family)